MVGLYRKRCPAKFSDDTIISHPIFADFSSSFFSAIEIYFQVRTYDAGTVLTMSQPENTLFALIKHGEMHITETLKSGGGKTSLTLKCGQSFGEANLVDPGFSVIECKAVEPVELLVLTYNNFQEMTGKDSRGATKFFLNLSNMISERLVELNNEYITLYYKTIIEAQTAQ